MIFSKREFDDDEDEFLIDQIKMQEPEIEEEINFDNIQNGKSSKANKERWTILKKLVNSRIDHSLS